LIIRPAAAGDVEGLARVHAAAWAAAYGHVLPPEVMPRFGRDQRRLLWRGLLVESARPPWVDVALLDDAEAPDETLAGFVWSRRVAPPDAAFAAEIVALNVLPSHWRRGIGRRLMGTACARLRAAGADSLYLWVMRDNPPARGFYEALGGRIVDQGEERLEEVIVPTVAYAWRSLDRLAAACRGAP